MSRSLYGGVRPCAPAAVDTCQPSFVARAVMLRFATARPSFRPSLASLQCGGASEAWVSHGWIGVLRDRREQLLDAKGLGNDRSDSETFGYITRVLSPTHDHYRCVFSVRG